MWQLFNSKVERPVPSIYRIHGWIPMEIFRRGLTDGWVELKTRALPILRG
jgi:hypothetical protein